MRFSVRVPVLSTHSTPTEPRVSTAASRRTRTLRRDKCSAASAIKTVSTRGNSCGKSAIARASPPSKPPIRSPRNSIQAILVSVHKIPTRIAIRVTHLVVIVWSGLLATSTPANPSPIWPIALSAPVALTRIRACPLTTSVPPETPAPKFLETATDSPVKEDSSTVSPAASLAASSAVGSAMSINVPSAGIRSPSPNRTKSPTTSCVLGIRSGGRFFCPSLRTTRAWGAARSLSASNALSARRFWTTVKTITIRAKPSNRLASAESPSTR